VRRAKVAGRLAIIMGTQGASMIANEFARVRTLYRLGLRCIQLTYTSANLYGDGCGEPRDAGLTLQGREFVDAVNELAMWLDLSHCGHRTTTEAIDRARRPVITHANSYTVHPSDRNKKDEAVRAVVAKGGMVGVAMPPRFITSRPEPSLGDLLDHVDHFVSLVGYEHVGTGFDFTEKLVETKSDLPAAVRWRRLRPDIFGSVDEFAQRRNPTGIQTIRQAPNFTQGLIDRGYVDEQVLAIIGDNWLRTFGTLAP
jgi:membrane dipeptidase